MSVNKVILLGYVGQDPEIRYPEKGKSLAFISLATNDYYPSTGAEVTEWHRLVMGGKHAEIAEKYIRKGTRLYVEGKIKSREYTDKLNIRRRMTEIIVENLELLGRSSEQ
ncbi:MAG: single-stranded DNA-binding protein [Muribaculaceae bacterium]|nr:single-stranded DNA-binding protein [Muribaculaceae bacterium]